MASTTKELLALQPVDALIKMVNDENGTKFPSGIFDVGLPEVVSGALTKIRLTAREPRASIDDVPYEGSIDLEYERLNIDPQFRGVLSGFRPTLPTSTQILLDEITRVTGQKFYLEDFVLEDIVRSNAGPYVLKTKVESLRWVGQLPVQLIDLIELDQFFEDALPYNPPTALGGFDLTPQLVSPEVNLPFLNGCDAVNVVGLPVINVDAQDYLPLVDFVKRCVPTPGQVVNPTTSPWHVSDTPAPFNLWNAYVIDNAVALSESLVNPALDRVVVIQLSEYCTNFPGALLRVPYRSTYEQGTFTVEPRLTRFAVRSIINGTPYRAELNAIAAGSQFKLPRSTTSYSFNALGPWTVSMLPDKKNLYDAVVLYNGGRRSTDAKPADLSCNRVLQVVLSSTNRGYQGNFSIHYRAPIVMIDVLPNTRVSDLYAVDLLPTEGQAPYSTVLVSGAFAPGHSLDGVTNRVVGRATASGTWRQVIDVTDANGVKVRYAYQYATNAVALVVAGNAPDGKQAVPYSYQYLIEGGYGPYQVLVEQGSLPPGLFLNPTTGALIGEPQIWGNFTWTIIVTDSRGTPARLTNTMKIIL